MLWPTAYVLRWTWMQFIKAWGVMQTMERNTELGLVHLYWGRRQRAKPLPLWAWRCGRWGRAIL